MLELKKSLLGKYLALKSLGKYLETYLQAFAKKFEARQALQKHKQWEY
jgi:hypothetical protein